MSALIKELNEDTLSMLEERIPPGVDEAAYVKATYLSAVSLGKEVSIMSRKRAVELFC